MSKRVCLQIVFVTSAAVFGLILSSCRHVRASETLRPSGITAVLSGAVSGHVEFEEGPVDGAVVRIRATDRSVFTGPDGRFVFEGLSPADPVVLTAWAEGYYVGGGLPCTPGDTAVVLSLRPLHIGDHRDYEWMSAYSQNQDPGNCQNCHAEPADPDSHLPFDEWVKDAHARSAKNPRFLTMYLGTDMAGNRSPLTRHASSRDYGAFPLPPDLKGDYHGPGYKLDFPDSEGNCAACHVPAEAVDDAYGTDPTNVARTGEEGIGCDFCHKVWDIRINPSTGLPYDNSPGVLSFEFRRPPEGHQFFAGPLDDVAPGEDTYAPVQTESRYCAPCHFGKFWGVAVYNSFGEWLSSPYSDPETGRTCQDCHMPSGQTDRCARQDQGGQRRDPRTLFAHMMPGAADVDLIRNAVTLAASVHERDGMVNVNVDIVNDRTGHYVPTDSPLRHCILLVVATNTAGDTLEMSKGPVLPDWCGTGDPTRGYYAGLPGKAFAKILEEMWTGVSPTGAYWNMTSLVSDTRLAPFTSDRSSYVFHAPVAGPVSVEVKLIFRRAFIQLADWKGWEIPDITMESKFITVQL